MDNFLLKPKEQYIVQFCGGLIYQEKFTGSKPLFRSLRRVIFQFYNLIDSLPEKSKTSKRLKGNRCEWNFSYTGINMDPDITVPKARFQFSRNQ